MVVDIRLIGLKGRILEGLIKILNCFSVLLVSKVRAPSFVQNLGVFRLKCKRFSKIIDSVLILSNIDVNIAPLY